MRLAPRCVCVVAEQRDYWYPTYGPDGGKSSSRSHSSPLTGTNGCGAVHGLPEEDVELVGLIPCTARP